MPNRSKSNDDASERPQDWEMLSLSALSEPKPLGDASSSDNTDGNAGPSSTGSYMLHSQGISDYQLQSKYYEMPSSSFAENPIDESKENPEVKECAEVGEPYVGDSGTVLNKDGAEGVSADFPKVDWLESSHLLTSRPKFGSDEACQTVPQHSAVKNEKAENWHQAQQAEDLHPSKKVKDQLNSGDRENENEESGDCFTIETSHMPSKIWTGYSNTTDMAPIFDGAIQGEAPQVYSCLDNEEAECLAGMEREILAEPEYTYPETFDEAYMELKPEDVKLIPETTPRSKSKKTWWKQQVEVLGVQISQASALWSLALAAAVMGLVVLGQRWQNERLQNQQLRLQLGSKDEKINQLVFQVSRLKDVVSGRRRIPVLRS